MDYTLNIKGQLVDLQEPLVMGILNVTPDSFYAASRQQTETEIAARANQIIAEGGTMIDIGACSTRPGAELASEAEETERLRMALAVVRSEQPDSIVSVDTFRPNVARMAVEEFGADIINDVGGSANTHHPSSITQTDMFRLVAKMGVPYIYMSSKPTLHEILLDFAESVQQLRDMGQKDIILDPGFGFGKTLEQNYGLLQELERLQVMELPILVGLSRKSMIYKLLDSTPADALNGTTALHAVALMKGASILRVHDVREAVECCRLMSQLKPLSVQETPNNKS
jgi:dihydropteroate synthase